MQSAAGPGSAVGAPSRKALDRLLEHARKDHSGVVVMRGEAGVGKTALLDYLAERAHGFRIVRAVGIESEMELAYAGLHQLCAPLLDGLEKSPRAAARCAVDCLRHQCR